jgi:hypothetical protein
MDFFDPSNNFHKILDTAKLFHANLAIDDIIFTNTQSQKEKSL